MTRRAVPAVILLAFGLVATTAATARQSSSVPADLGKAIDQLGAFDFDTRTKAAQVVRRAPADLAVRALTQAARAHRDEYVRFRALVILSGFGDAASGPVMRDLMGDRNDRLCTVAYQWFEHHPDTAVLPALISALSNERSEFVRPALTRAIAAESADPRARDALVPLVTRGDDLFRSAVIEALGDYGARYALDPIVQVAALDGPLQDDAIAAIGELGDSSLAATLASLQASVPRERLPTISAALCLLGVDCAAQVAYLKQVLAFTAAGPDEQPWLRSVARALSLVAKSGREDALNALLDAGVPASDAARAPIALAVGRVAIRNPTFLLRTLETRTDLAGAVDLVRDAFDMLSEDFEEERFYGEMRQAYWAVAGDPPRHRAADELIRKLEF